MAHKHDHTHDKATGNITVAFVLNLLFSIAEFIGGFYTNSIAIISDAVHDAGDALSLGVAWYLQRLSRRGRDKRFSYGYRRFSLLGAVFISIVLVVSSFFILRESIGRLWSPAEPSARGMLIMAVVGVVVNGAAALRMRGGRSMNERAVMLHLMEDVLGWAAVLVASVVMLFVHAPFLDPLLSIGISIWVLCNVWRNLCDTFTVLLQGTPSGVDTAALEREIMAIEGVASLHDLHVWTLDGEENIASLHVAVENGTDFATVRQAVHNICLQHGIGHSTVEIERDSEACGYDKCSLE